MLDLKPLGVAFPINFASNKLSRKTVNRGRTPISGTMELYFSLRPVEVQEIDFLEPGSIPRPAQAFYRKHHVYGDHRFLIPTTKQQIEKYEAPWGARIYCGTIGRDPTIATKQEMLQLIPCSETNLELFKEKLLTEPFYLEITRDNFVLHIIKESARELKVPAQDYSPVCWHGFGHPVVTVRTKMGGQPIGKFIDIRWQEIADGLVASLRE